VTVKGCGAGGRVVQDGAAVLQHAVVCMYKNNNNKCRYDRIDCNNNEIKRNDRILQ